MSLKYKFTTEWHGWTPNTKLEVIKLTNGYEKGFSGLFNVTKKKYIFMDIFVFFRGL